MESTEVEPVEESIQHFCCITAFILMTVFDKHHKSTFITTAFEKLPVHVPQLVFEDVSEDNLVSIHVICSEHLCHIIYLLLLNATAVGFFISHASNNTVMSHGASEFYFLLVVN